ncbi:MAG: hypothetical protein ABIQ11_03370 [Saprospiraceae bacterium]
MNFKTRIQIACTFILLSVAEFVSACPVCERNQPKLLKGVVHGSGPDSQWDYVIMWAVLTITIVSLYLSVKWVIRPGEKNADHIKYSILNQE